jgi:hypothetical protein
MRRSRFSLFVACLLTLLFGTSLRARSQAWAFLGYTRLDSRQDHSKIRVTRRDGSFGVIRLRVSDAIFFDRLIVRFGNGTSREFIISERILPEGRNFVLDVASEPRLFESVELWYYQEPWGSNPRVTLYGIPSGSIDNQPGAPDH